MKNPSYTRMLQHLSTSTLIFLLHLDVGALHVDDIFFELALVDKDRVEGQAAVCIKTPPDLSMSNSIQLDKVLVDHPLLRFELYELRLLESFFLRICEHVEDHGVGNAERFDLGVASGDIFFGIRYVLADTAFGDDAVVVLELKSFAREECVPLALASGLAPLLKFAAKKCRECSKFGMQLRREIVERIVLDDLDVGCLSRGWPFGWRG